MIYKYNWDKYPEVIKFLARIYSSTRDRLSKREGCRIGVLPYKAALELTYYLEDFLYLVKEKEYSFEQVFSSLSTLQYFEITNCSLISSLSAQSYKSKIVLDKCLYQGENIDLIGNPEIKKTRRLALYKALAERVFKFRNEDTLDFCKTCASSLDEYKTNAQVLADNGWLLLENVLSTETAKMFTSMVLKESYSFFNPEEEYQIAVLFGMTLNNANSAVKNPFAASTLGLIDRAFGGKFSNEVISEYIQNDKHLELFQILYMMGLLFNEKNKMFPIMTLNEQEQPKLVESLHWMLTSLATFSQTDCDYGKQTSLRNLNQTETVKMRKLINNKKIEM